MDISLTFHGENIDNLIAQSAADMPYRVPLYRAARSGIVRVIEPQQGTTIPRRCFKDTHAGHIIVLADEESSAGPSGWSCARRVRRWAAAVVIHVVAREAEHYETAVKRAMAFRRLVLIETTAERVEAWLQLFAPLPRAVVTGSAGTVDQAPIDPRKLQ